MFCSQCGSQIPDEAKFCNVCGNKVGGTPVQTINEQEAAVAISPIADGTPDADVNASVASQVQQVSPEPQVVTPQQVSPEPQVVTPQQVNPQPQTISPAPQAYAPQPTFQPVQTKQQRQPSGGRKAGAVIFCILGAFLLCSFIALTSIRVSVSKVSIRQMMKSIEEEYGYEEVISDVSYSFKHSGIKGIEDIDDIDEIATEIIHGYLTYILTGEGEPIDIDAVVDWVEDNEKALEKASGQEISKEDIKELKRELNELNDEFIEEIEDSEGELLVIQKVFKLTTFLIMLGAVIACFLIVFLFLGKFYDKSFVYTGVTVTIVSLMMAACAGLFTAFFASQSASIDDIGFFGEFLATRCLVTSLAFAVVGIINIILGKALKKKNKAYFA